MPRFTDPFHKSGDSNVPGWLVDAGKKLLGYLDQQRRLSGIQTISQTRRFSDGSSVTAAFFGNLAKVTYRVGPTGVVQEVSQTIEGFVVRPTDESQPFVPLSQDEVVLDPTLAWKEWVYDATHIDPTGHDHVSPPRGSNFYKKTWPQDTPTTGQPPGLNYAGNVDWRNSDETLLVTWYGPRSRYFFEPVQTGSGVVNIRQPYVFCKGKAIFSLTDFETALIGAPTSDTTTWITGACIQQTDNGLVLLVAVQRIDTSTGTVHSGYATYTDYIISAVLKGEPISAYLTVVQGSATLLGSRQWEMVDDGDGGQYLVEMDKVHPWFWNSDGTEARCMRGYTSGLGQDDQRARELILSTPIDGSATFAVDDVPYPPLVTVTTGSQTLGYFATAVTATGVAMSSIEVTCACTSDPDGVVVTGPSSYTSPTGDVYEATYLTGTPATKQLSASATADQAGGVKIAVDYRGNDPVYAYTVATHIETSQTVSSDWSATAEFTNSQTGSISYVPCPGSDTTLSSSVNAQHSLTWSANYLSTAHQTGIDTDFFTYTGGPYVTSRTITGGGTESSIGSGIYTTGSVILPAVVAPVNFFTTQPDPTSTCYYRCAAIHPLTTPPAPSTDYHFVTPGKTGTVPSGGGGIDGSWASSGTTTSSVSGSTDYSSQDGSGFVVYYLDLRKKIIAYFINSYTESNNINYSGSYSTPWFYDPSVGSVSPALSGGGMSSVFSTLYDQRVVMNGSEVYEATGNGPTNPGSPISGLTITGIVANGIFPSPTYPDPYFTIPFTDTSRPILAESPLLNTVCTCIINITGTGMLFSGPGLPGDHVPADWNVSLDGTVTNHLQFNTSFGVAASSIFTNSYLEAHAAYFDNIGFKWIGAWQSYKDAWVFSQCAVSGTDYVSGRASGASGGDLFALTGAPSYDTMFWPITVLPKTNAVK